MTLHNYFDEYLGIDEETIHRVFLAEALKIWYIDNEQSLNYNKYNTCCVFSSGERLRHAFSFYLRQIIADDRFDIPSDTDDVY